MPESMKEIKLRFVRLPNEVVVWTHELLYQDEEVIVSRFKFSGLQCPTKIKGVEVVDNGYDGTCYEFLNRGFEIIKILDFEDNLTGYYCNINTRPKIFDGGYEVTDLFLDLWVFPNLEYVVLDEEEFEEASKKGWLKKEESRFARDVLKNLIKDIKAKEFPPRIVSEVG